MSYQSHLTYHIDIIYYDIVTVNNIYNQSSKVKMWLNLRKGVIYTMVWSIHFIMHPCSQAILIIYHLRKIDSLVVDEFS